MSFYHLPNPWDPGYAIPKYVMAEPPERGTFTTQWLPRGTISSVIPDYLAKPGQQIPGQQLLGRPDAGLGSLGGSSIAGSCLAGDSLDAQVYTLEPLGGANGDPVAAYGQQAAAWLMGTIGQVPAPQRKAALRALLDAVDPSLWSGIDSKAATYKAQGLPAKAALQRAIAECMSTGIAKEIVEAGRRAMDGRAPVAGHSQLALGASAAARDRAAGRAFEALGFSISSLNPVTAVVNGARAVASGVTSVVKGTVNAAGEVWDGTKWVGGKISSGAKSAATWVKNGVNKLGDLACKLASSPIGQVGAGAAAGAGGAPPQVGIAGAQAVATVCAPAAVATAPPPPPAPSTPSWLLPAAAVGGGLVLFLALRR